MRTLVKDNEDFISKFNTVALKACTLAPLEMSLKESIKEVLNYKKKLEEDLFVLKDELVDTSDHLFESAKEQVAFFYPELNLSEMESFIEYVIANWWKKKNKCHPILGIVYLLTGCQD